MKPSKPLSTFEPSAESGQPSFVDWRRITGAQRPLVALFALAALLACAGAQAQSGPMYPPRGGGSGLTQVAADARYLKLDASNDPVTGDLVLNAALAIGANLTIGDGAADAVTVNGASWTFASDTTFALTGGTNGLNIDANTLSIDAANNRVGIGTASPSAVLHSRGPYPQLRVESEAGVPPGILLYENGTLRGGFAYDVTSAGHPRTVTSFYGPNASGFAVLHLDTQGDAVFTRAEANARSLIFDGVTGTLTGNDEAEAQSDLVWRGDTMTVLQVDVSADALLSSGHHPFVADTHTLGTLALQWDRGFFDDGAPGIPSVAVGVNDAGLGYIVASDAVTLTNAGAVYLGTNAVNTSNIALEAGGDVTIDAGGLSGSTDGDVSIAATGATGDMTLTTASGGDMTLTTDVLQFQATYARMPRYISTAPVKPTCNTSTPGAAIIYVDDTDDANRGIHCACSADSAGAYTWLGLDNLTACPGT